MYVLRHNPRQGRPCSGLQGALDMWVRQAIKIVVVQQVAGAFITLLILTQWPDWLDDRFLNKLRLKSAAVRGLRAQKICAGRNFRSM